MRQFILAFSALAFITLFCYPLAYVTFPWQVPVLYLLCFVGSGAAFMAAAAHRHW